MGRYSNIENLFISNNNIRFERRDLKKRSEVRVINDSCNYILHTYRFNNVKIEYNTKYMNWANVNCSGGWIWDKIYLRTAVQNDSKLYSGLSEDEFNLIDVYDENLIYGRESDGHYFICKKGCVSDYIDIEHIFNVYNMLGVTLFEDDKQIIRDMCQENIKTYADVNNKFNFDYANPKRVYEFIFNGMLLGYPVETTVSILENFM